MDIQNLNSSAPNKSLQALMNYKNTPVEMRQGQQKVVVNIVLITLALFLITLFIGHGIAYMAILIEAMVFIFLVRNFKALDK